MELDEVLNNVKKWAINIEQLIYLTDNIKGKEHLKAYKLVDLQQLGTVIKKCERCDNYFIPNPNLKKWQKFCDIHCRNKAVSEGVYQRRLDARQKPIDLLRKSIYERKFRANRDNYEIDMVGYGILLKKLTTLSKTRWNMTDKEFKKKMDDLHYEYDTLVRIGRGKKYEQKNK